MRDLARLIGRMTATSPAILQAPLRYRNLQRLKIQAAQDTVVRDHSCPGSGYQRELDWWITSMISQSGKSILTQEPDFTMEADASLLGWGAVCEGVRTDGLWSPVERLAHINCLELTAAMFAVKAFSRNKDGSHIHLKLDNKTAVSYVNHMGGTRSPQLNSVTTQLWTWCLERGITLSAEHLLGVDNCIADMESRTIHPSAELQLRKDIFQDLMQEVYQCDVDLFASRLNHQLPQFISWRPDPYAVGTDALQVPWTRWRGYAFPPFALISKVLRKVREERSTILLIAPVWESQPWYPTLLSMLVDFPTLLPIHKDLLTDTFGQHHPLMLVDQLQLAAPTRIYNRRHFCRSRTVAVFQDGVRAPTRLTRVPGRSGSVGVSHGTWIPFVFCPSLPGLPSGAVCGRSAISTH